MKRLFYRCWECDKYVFYARAVTRSGEKFEHWHRRAFHKACAVAVRIRADDQLELVFDANYHRWGNGGMK